METLVLNVISAVVSLASFFIARRTGGQSRASAITSIIARSITVVQTLLTSGAASKDDMVVRYTKLVEGLLSAQSIKPTPAEDALIYAAIAELTP